MREKLCELAMRYIEFQRFLIMAEHLHRNIVLGNFCHGRVHSRPFAARATINALPMAANSCFDQSRKACLTIASAFAFPSSARSARSCRPKVRAADWRFLVKVSV